MNRLILIAVLLTVVPACTTTLYGNQTSGGGSSTTTTGSAVRGSTQLGNAPLSGSFGTPPPAYASGGQVTFGNSGSAVLMIGLAIAGLVEVASDWFSNRRRSAASRWHPTVSRTPVPVMAGVPSY